MERGVKRGEERCKEGRGEAQHMSNKQAREAERASTSSGDQMYCSLKPLCCLLLEKH
jgi:hypothetical protein